MDGDRVFRGKRYSLEAMPGSSRKNISKLSQRQQMLADMESKLFKDIARTPSKSNLAQKK